MLAAEYLARRSTIERVVEAFLVVEREPTTDRRLGLGHAGVGLEVDLLVLEASPQPFDEDVVQVAVARVEATSTPLHEIVVPSSYVAESVARLCAILPLKQVAAFFELHWGTVKVIDKRHLEEALGPIDLSGVSVIAMDEFAIQKGPRYATVIIDPTVKRVLWVGHGRGRCRQPARSPGTVTRPPGSASVLAFGLWTPDHLTAEKTIGMPSVG